MREFFAGAASGWFVGAGMSALLGLWSLAAFWACLGVGFFLQAWMRS